MLSFCVIAVIGSVCFLYGFYMRIWQHCGQFTASHEYNPLKKLLVIFSKGMGFSETRASVKSGHKTGVTFEIPLSGI